MRGAAVTRRSAKRSPGLASKRSQRKVQEIREAAIKKHKAEKKQETTKLVELLDSVARVKIDQDELAYIRKAIMIIVIGFLMLGLGLFQTFIHFKMKSIDNDSVVVMLTSTTGPITLATAILTIIWGSIWIKVIKEYSQKRRIKECRKFQCRH